MIPALATVDAWIFDLDNTLYPAATNLFALIDARMTDYIATLKGCGPDEAYGHQKAYFRQYGTTLAGLIADHDTDPHEFLDYVHDIELDRVDADTRLVANIARLPGRKLVFTNGDAPYAQRVLDRLGLGTSFEAIHDIHAMDYVPKPAPVSYAALCERWDINPATALFVEDMVRNLAPAKALGMTTVWINNGSEQAGGEPCPSYVDYEIADLSDWLHEITGEFA
jgi:putative hydrolase of the HAD superfamily